MIIPTPEPERSNVGRAAVVLAALLFGTSATAAGRWSPGLGGTSLAGWRLMIGGTTLALLSAAGGCAPWKYRLPGRAVVVGAVTVVGFQVCYFAAVGRLGIGQATMLTIATAPIAAAIADHVRGRAAITPRWALGFFVAAIGIVVMSNASSVVDPLGWGLAVLAGIGFPIYGSVIGALAVDRPPLAAVATVFGAAVPLAAFIAIADDGAHVPAGTDIITVAYLGVVATAAAYYLWTRGLEFLPVRDTVLITMIEPVTATLLAAALLHQPLRPITLLGTVTILAGIAIAATGSTTITADQRRHRIGSTADCLRFVCDRSPRSVTSETLIRRPGRRARCAPD